MARYRAAVCRQCRREGIKLFLKGSRCFTDKCAIERRNYPPGQPGFSLLTFRGVMLCPRARFLRLSFFSVGQWVEPPTETPGRCRRARRPGASDRQGMSASSVSHGS